MSETLVNFFTNSWSGVLPSELIVFIISMIPILELRGGLLAASILHIEMYKAIALCICGNLLPIPFILLFIKKVLKWMKNKKYLSKVAYWLENKCNKKSHSIIKYEFLGLMLFIGIPLPGTGAWTGALIAALIGMNFKKAFSAVLAGICMACIIMCFLAYGIPQLL